MNIFTKNKKPYWIGVVLTFLLLFSLPMTGRYYSDLVQDVYYKILTYDLGFSSFTMLTSGGLASEEKPVSKAEQIILASEQFPALLRNYIYGVERPQIETIDISIKFKHYEKLLKDRNKAIKKGLGVDFQEVKGKITHGGQKFDAKIKLKGDHPKHWTSLNQMSLRVSLKDNQAIMGYKTFSLHALGLRQHPFDQTFEHIMKNVGNLSSAHKYVRVILNGDEWGIMNMEEHISKAFVVKQKQIESVLVKIQNDEELLQYRHKNKHPYEHYRLSSPLSIKAYNDKKYFKDEYNRKIYSYIAQQTLRAEPTIYDTDALSKALLGSLAWGNTDTLTPANSKYYFNQYTLTLSPITTDQGAFAPVTDKLVLPPPYSKLVQNTNFQESVKRNEKVLAQAFASAKKVASEYQAFFPLDSKIDTSIVTDNIASWAPLIDSYLVSSTLQNGKEIITLPTKKQAKKFSHHIHARHYTNGEVHIYNLLPFDVELSFIDFNGQPLEVPVQTIKGYSDKSVFTPTVVQTNIKKIADKSLFVHTKYKGFERTFRINRTLTRDGFYNPLIANKTQENQFLKKTSKNTWQISKGKWNINKPLVINGNLNIASGTTLQFATSAYLIVKGSLTALGTTNAKIALVPQKDKWKGVYVLGATEYSEMRFVTVKNTSGLQDGLLGLTAGVTFYKSNVAISHSQFLHSFAEDALNIVNAQFAIEHILIDGGASDGLDVEFGEGEIDNSRFVNLGGDGLDFAGSKVRVSSSYFAHIKDKAVSVGEASKANLQDLQIENVLTGITSKDGSVTKGTNITISHASQNALTTYSRKTFYDSPSLTLTGVILKENENNFLRHKDSTMNINNQNIQASTLSDEHFYAK